MEKILIEEVDQNKIPKILILYFVKKRALKIEKKEKRSFVIKSNAQKYFDKFNKNITRKSYFFEKNVKIKQV